MRINENVSQPLRCSDFKSLFLSLEILTRGAKIILFCTKIFFNKQIFRKMCCSLGSCIGGQVDAVS